MRDQQQPPDVTQDAEIALQCACFNLRKTARAVTQLYNAMLQPSGLLATQFSVLVALALASPLAISSLAEVLGMDRTTLARNLKPLQRRGLVRVEQSEDDRRIQLVALTPKGQEALSAAMPLWRKAQHHTVSHLGESRWQTLTTDLSTLVAVAQA
jgi:DNA-binding MarR family transcriptional regulator